MVWDDILGVHRIKDLHDTDLLACKIAARMQGGSFLMLAGSLGVGKTTFVQALARCLGVRESVTSPSFTIVAEYTVLHHALITRLIHADLYRLDREALMDSAVQSLVEYKGIIDCCIVVEWADRLPPTVFPEGLWVTFRYGKGLYERVITVK